MAEEEDDLLAPPTEEELLELQQVRERKQAMKLKRQQKREECDSCGKVVYATERMQVDDLLLHKNCFRCEVCNSKLSLGTFASVNGKLYCNKDFHAMFSSGGGSYDVFGDAGFKKHTGRATAPKEVSHAHTTGGATVNQEGAMETVHLKPTPKREKVEEEAGAGGIAVTLKPTPKREKVEEEKGGGVAVNLRPTPKVEKEEAGGAVPIKNQVALKKAPKVEKKQESSKLETVHLKSTPKVSCMIAMTVERRSMMPACSVDAASRIKRLEDSCVNCVLEDWLDSVYFVLLYWSYPVFVEEFGV